MITKIDGKHGGAPEGTWVSDKRIEIPCIYFLYRLKSHKSSEREKMKQCEKDFIFLKSTSFQFIKANPY